MVEALVLVALGLTGLFLGGHWLVGGAVSLARHLRVPPVMIGMTVVAIGTSAPEFVVTFKAALDGHPAIALGNIIGSNIANILLVLGVSALIFPLKVNRTILRRDGPMMLGVTLLFAYMCLSGAFGWQDGLMLVGLLLIFTSYTLYCAYIRRNKKDCSLVEELPPEISWFKTLAFLVAGVVMLPVASGLLVEGASTLALLAGVSEAVIGVTLVALGSSAPEVVACSVAAWQRHNDIAVGNVIGSNLLNILLGIALPALTVGLPVDPVFLELDVWVMVGATLVLALAMQLLGTLYRPVGAVFLLGYVAYLTTLLHPLL